MAARATPPAVLNNLLRSQLENTIHEAALHPDDELIARRYLIEKQAQIDIAAELGWRRESVGERIRRINARLLIVAAALYPEH